MTERQPWWKGAVVYQIYPRSFCDSNGDGVGDLGGIARHLDHLEWLGVDALWLSPIYPSPMVDLGYDVADFCDVDPVFGDLADFDLLLEEAHRRGIKVLMDWVANHTSDQHPWFLDSRSSRSSRRRNWYFWRDGKPDGSPPNNWSSAFGGGAWTWDDRSGQWYLHLFFPEQPDLDWSNLEVRDAMQRVLRFWLDRGVDGFRADVVNLIGKPPGLPDVAPELAGRSLIDLWVDIWDRTDTYRYLQEVRRTVGSYPGDRVVVGEIHTRDMGRLVDFYERGGLPLVFNFALQSQDWVPADWRRVLEQAEAVFRSPGTWPTLVLSNHDIRRIRTRFEGSEARARVAAVILLTLRGTAFIYQGDELGMVDGVGEAYAADPTGRLGCRAPVPWDMRPLRGWGAQPWLPWAPEADHCNVAARRAQPSSILHLYRELLHLRRSSHPLKHGSWRILETPSAILGYERRAGAETLVVYANFGDEDATVGGPHNGAPLLVSSSGTNPSTWDGTLAATSAVVLAV